MDVFYLLRAIILYLPFLFINFTHVHHVEANNNNGTDENPLGGLIERIKRGAVHFTGCSIDMLLKHCDKDTSVNFECFRSLGECFSSSARVAFLDDEDYKQEEEKDL